MAFKGYKKEKSEALMRSKELERIVTEQPPGFNQTPNTQGPTQRVAQHSRRSDKEGSWFFGISESKKLTG